MVIVDTSVWVNHFYKRDLKLEALLHNNEVIMHEFIVGELACGNLKNRNLILSLFDTLPKAETVNSEKYLHFLEKQKLFGLGLGFVDLHLLVSAYLSENHLFTYDKALAAAAKKFSLLF